MENEIDYDTLHGMLRVLSSQFWGLSLLFACLSVVWIHLVTSLHSGCMLHLSLSTLNNNNQAESLEVKH